MAIVAMSHQSVINFSMTQVGKGWLGVRVNWSIPNPTDMFVWCFVCTFIHIFPVIMHISHVNSFIYLVCVWFGGDYN
jgi:hypothetical protein